MKTVFLLLLLIFLLRYRHCIVKGIWNMIVAVHDAWEKK